MTIKKEIFDELITDYRYSEDLLGENGLLKQLTKQLLERTMEGELTHQFGYGKNEITPLEKPNRHNGASLKKVKSSSGELAIEVPRDRLGECEPINIPKHQRWVNGFDDKIISLYLQGLLTRDIQVHLEEISKIEISGGTLNLAGIPLVPIPLEIKISVSLSWK